MNLTTTIDRVGPKRYYWCIVKTEALKYPFHDTLASGYTRTEERAQKKIDRQLKKWQRQIAKGGQKLYKRIGFDHSKTTAEVKMPNEWDVYLQLKEEFEE